LLALLLSGLLAGCAAGAPVQQMYDARQAVEAAQKAGAAKYAPELLAEAQTHLKTAKASMDEGEYRSARDEADLARQKAMEARRAAEAAAPPKSRP
jgi:hypothetical protein